MTLTHPPFPIAPREVTPLLTSPLLPPLLPFLVHGRCFRIWVLITYQFFNLSFSLRSFAPTSVPLPSTFRKLAGMTLLLTSILTVPLQKNTHLSLFLLLLLSSALALNAAKSSIPFGRIKPILKPGGPLKWKIGLVKDVRLSLPLTEVMKIARLTSPLLNALCLSSPKPRLGHGKRLALFSRPNLTLNLYSHFFALLLALLTPLLTSPTVPLSGNRLRSFPIT